MFSKRKNHQLLMANPFGLGLNIPLTSCKKKTFWSIIKTFFF